MIEHKNNRDKSDIFGMPLLGFIFKNQKFIILVRIFVLALFIYGVYLGFAEQGSENRFTRYLFWGFFWSFFMVVTLSTFGRIFCGICPHAFLGKYITRFGLKKEMPKMLKNPWWGLMLLVIGWWVVYYAYPGFYRAPFATAVLFVFMTFLAFLMYYLYKDMSYCKYICPIGSLTKAYHRVSFTWLGSYKSDCSECKTFDCASACPYNLKPFTFDNKNSMGDCSLCMECSNACDAISFKVVKPSKSLFEKFKIDKIEVWVYILITAAITVSMSFHHGLGRSAIAENLPWALTAKSFSGFIDFGGVDAIGLFAFIYAMIITLVLVYGGMYIASKALKAEFKKTFYTLGYAFAPIFIIGGLDHLLHSFFTHTYADIVNGFIYGFGLDVQSVANLASRGDAWLGIFGVFKYLAIAWAFLILYKRVNLFEASKKAKAVAFFGASLLILFYLALILIRVYAMNVYGKSSHSHHHGAHGMHASHKSSMFQSVSQDKAMIIQKGDNKASCSQCGMNLPMFYKTNHLVKDDKGDMHQYCSIHCMVHHKQSATLSDEQVVDASTLKFIDAKKAYYVIGSSQKGTMSRVSKYAFFNKSDAVAFTLKYGGELSTYEEALEVAKKDFK
jgi:nitrous oxide reductase accessory protein NosL